MTMIDIPLECAGFAVVIAYTSTLARYSPRAKREAFSRGHRRFHSGVTRTSLTPNFNVPLIIDYYAF